MARGADALKPSRARGARAGEIELHRASHLRDVPGAFALRATHRAAARSRLGSMTGFADLLVADVQADLCAADRLPEIGVERVLQIRAALRCGRLLGLTAPAE